VSVDTEDETRRRLLELLDDAHSFDELRRSFQAQISLVAPRPALLEGALRFAEEGDASGLDAEFQERFAQVLSRFVESKRALELAGKLEADDAAERC
jgi:hypothetical protein